MGAFSFVSPSNTQQVDASMPRLINTLPSGSTVYQYPDGSTQIVPQGGKLAPAVDPSGAKAWVVMVPSQADGGFSLSTNDPKTLPYANQFNVNHSLNLSSGGDLAVHDTGNNTATAISGSGILGKASYVPAVGGAIIGGVVGGPAGAVAGYTLGAVAQRKLDNADGHNGIGTAIDANGWTGATPVANTGGGSSTVGQQNLTAFQDSLNKQAAASGPTTAPKIDPTGITTGPAQGYTPPSSTAQGYTAATAAPATGYTAPQAGPAQGYTAGQAGYTGYTPSTEAYAPTVTAGTAQAGHVTPTVIGAPGQIQAPVIAKPADIKAGTVTAQQITPVQAAGPQQVSATGIDRQMLDRQNADQSRAQFQEALAKIKLAADGSVPSAAEALMQKGIDENVGTAYGLAASLQGRNPGQALRAGAVTAKDAIAKSAADMAALRATEQATARGQLADFTKSLNANDIQQGGLQLAADVDVAKSNAFNLLDAAKSNQGAGVQTAIANLGAMVDVLKANQASALAAGQANAANDLQAKIENLHALISVSTSNAANNLTTQINNIQNQIEVAKANQATALAAGQTNAINETNVSIANMTQQLNAAIANMNMIQSVNKDNAQFMNNASQFAADAYNKTQQFNITAQNTAAQFGAEQTNITNRYNTGLNATAAQFLADQTNTTNRFNTGEINSAGQFNVGQTNTTDRANADRLAQALQFSSQQANDLSKFNAGQTLTAQTTNSDLALRQQIVNDARAAGYRSDQISILLAQAGYADKALDRSVQKSAADEAFYASLLGIGIKAYSAYEAGSGTLSKDASGNNVVIGANGAPILD